MISAAIGIKENNKSSNYKVLEHNLMNNNSKPIIMGNDHAGFHLKNIIKKYLTDMGIDVEDAGAHTEESVDYSDFGISVASMVSSGSFERGILICGTGLGMSMAANRFSNVRAALCNGIFSAEMSRRHNNSNILVMGSRVTGEGVALEIVKHWLATPFDGGRHQMRIEKFNNMGKRI